MNASGALIAESLSKDSPLDGVDLHVRKISRVDVGDVSAGQPLTWTFIEFEVDEHVVTDLAEALSLSKKRVGRLVLRLAHRRRDLRSVRRSGLSVSAR